jgi:hypothetical protein
VSHTAAHLLARLHALAARFRAYAAVFVPARVPLAFIAAQATRRRAGDEHPTNELVIRAGAPGGDASRDIADIGAVEIEPDALGQLLDHFLGKASVGARGARLGAGITLLDATDQSIVGASAHIWVHTDHLLNLHAFLSGLAVAPRAGNANPAATVREKPDLWGLYRSAQRRQPRPRPHPQRGPRRILGTRAAGAALEIHASPSTLGHLPAWAGITIIVCLVLFLMDFWFAIVTGRLMMVGIGALALVIAGVCAMACWPADLVG